MHAGRRTAWQRCQEDWGREGATAVTTSLLSVGAVGLAVLWIAEPAQHRRL